MIARAPEDRRAMRRRALRHGHAGPAGRLRADLGSPGTASGRMATRRVRERFPGFCFMAEVYWDLEWTLQQQGFDYAYDKRLYDRLREGMPGRCASTSCAGLDYQRQAGPVPRKPRRATGGGHVSAGHARGRGRHHVSVARPAVLPQGQFEGRSKRISPHLVRAPVEPSTTRCNSSTIASWRCSGSRPFATASGACSNAPRPGTATGRGIASWPVAGTVETAAAVAGRSTTPRARASATCVSPLPT